MTRRLAGDSISGPCRTISFTCRKCRRRWYMFTIGHAQKWASRPTCLAYSSVILTRASGAAGMARAQSGDGGNGCGLSDDVSALATDDAPPAITEAIASAVPVSRMFRRSGFVLVVMLRSQIDGLVYWAATFSTSGSFHTL